MKSVLFIFSLFFTFSLNSQVSEEYFFKRIKFDTYTFIKNIKNNNTTNPYRLKEFYNKKLENIAKLDLEKDSIFTASYFIEKGKNNYQITIFSVKLLKKRKNEHFIRGEYYFVLTIKAILENQKVEYIIDDFFIEDYYINIWWLSRYKNYLKDTKSVFSKFKYMPPPPPPPPKNLK